MIGDLLNQRYRLDAELGRGGMGIVYRAHDVLLDRDVAVKVLSSSGIGSEGRARLLHEAQAVAKLNHPNIVKVYDAGRTGDETYIVMELLEGNSLFEKRPTDLDEILAIIRQVCAALDHAHQHGIIHRDLKLENVIVSAGGNVTLTDFGLARSVASRMTTEGVIVGTVFYLSPEQALGQPVDGRTDLYALGVMLYELTARRLPFTGEDPLTIISQHLYAPVVPPSTHNSAIPIGLDSLIVRLLSKKPEDRPAAAAEVLQALDSPTFNVQAFNVQTNVLDRLARGRLVGREREFAEAKAVWLQTLSTPGERHVLLISGESGVGKTPLVREITALVKFSGARMLSTECHAEGNAPYAAFVEIIRDALGPGMEIGEEILSDLLALAPDLQGRYPHVSPGTSFDPESDQQRLFESATALFAALAAQTPVLLVVEDIHWADGGTLYLLRHLARRTRTLKLPLLILLTYREVEVTDACCLDEFLLDLNRERLAAYIHLSRLNREQTGELLTVLLQEPPAPELLDDIYHVTEGNLFFVEEVCKALIEEGKLYRDDGHWRHVQVDKIKIPKNVQATIQARVSKLSPQSQEVLRLAAIIGREFDFPTLKKASDLGEDELIDILEVAERAQIIEEIKPKFSGVAEGEMFAFAHALIPATLREGVSGLRRHRLHRRVAMALEELCPEDMPRLEVLAYHFEQAGEASQAHDYYLRAGERALAVFASREAERDYRAALNLSSSDIERAPSLIGLGEALFRQSRYAEALETWAEAIRLYQEAGNHDRVAWLYARSGRAAWYVGDTPRGLVLCLEGLDVVRKITGSVEPVETPGMAALLHETARAYRFNDKNEEGLPLCQQALAMAQRLNLVDVQAESLATLGILPNHPAEARRQALEQAVEIAEKAGLLATAARAHLNLGGYFQETGETGPSLQHCQRARELAHRMGMASWESNFAISYADIALEAGDFAAAEKVLAEVPQLYPLLVEPGRTVTEAYVKFLNANLLIRKGEWDEAIRLITQCIEECGQLPDPKMSAVGHVYLADALVEKGEYAAAEPVLLEALKALSKAPETDQLTVLCNLANLEVKQGQMDKARQYLAEAYRMAGESPVERVKALLAWSEANLAAAEQRWAEASEKYEVIAGLLKHMNLRWHAARIQGEWAEMLARSGEAGDLQRAREMMSDAATRFEQLGVPKYAALMRAQMRARLREKVNG